MSRNVVLRDVADLIKPGAVIPGAISFSPDEKIITFLWAQSGFKRSLCSLDVETGEIKIVVGAENAQDEGNYSIEEKLRRERARLMHTGITTYAWSDSGRILVQSGGSLLVQDGCDQNTLRVVCDSADLKNKFPDLPASSILDPRLHPSGNFVTFVWNSEVYISDIQSTNVLTKQITFGARENGITNGLADYLAQEEMDRFEGYWLNEDASLLAFQQVDDKHIPIFRIMHSGEKEISESAQEDHRYPFAGAENPKTKLGVVKTNSVNSTSTVWMDTDSWFGSDFYLARVCWNKNELIAQIQSRDQKKLKLISFDPNTGKGNLIFTEKAENYINLHHMFIPLSENEFIWASERTGYCHLYKYDFDGNEIAQLTSGKFVVEKIVGIDKKNNRIYYIGNSESSLLESHLFYCSIDGNQSNQSTKVTIEKGMHSIVMSPSRNLFVDQFSSGSTPYRINLCQINVNEERKIIKPIHEPNDPSLTTINLVFPEFFSFRSADSTVNLFGSIFRPDVNKYGNGPYPTMVFVYGGPHVQVVNDSWAMTTDLRMQYYVSQGYLVVRIDNRGSNRRGKVFEEPIFRKMGTIEVEDQARGVQYLIEKGLVDPNRVGIIGWSYGGYMSLMCLAKRPDVFKLAISGAPVTHWEGYDTHYTERYMGTPQNNPLGYQEGSVLNYTSQINGHLMIIHGLIDENVHFRHTAVLIDSLIKNDKKFEFLLLPNARHSTRSVDDRNYLEKKCFEFIKTAFSN